MSVHEWPMPYAPGGRIAHSHQEPRGEPPRTPADGGGADDQHGKSPAKDEVRAGLFPCCEEAQQRIQYR